MWLFGEPASQAPNVLPCNSSEGGEQFLILEYPILILSETLLISLATGVGPLGGGQIPIVIFSLIYNIAVKGCTLLLYND